MKGLLKIFPYSAIRFVLKYININALFFKYATIQPSQYITNDENYTINFYGMEKQLGYKIMAGFIAQAYTYTKPEKLQREYIIDGGKCYIEPKYGWGIRYGTNELVKDSMTYARHLESYYPSFFGYKFLNQKNVKHFEQVVSIRMIEGAEKNYWHFLSDILGVVTLIDKFNFPKDIPIVIDKKLADQKFFKEVVGYSKDLQQRNWVIQEHEYILADKVFFCQKMPNQKDQFDGLLQLLDIKDADKSINRKIFVKRSPKRIRFIQNHQEIEAIALKNGYEIVDCDNLSFAEQVKLFSECSHVIGIHGAGLTNIIWRKNAPLALLELFPANYVHPGYFWLAKSFDKKYLGLTGSNILPDTSFRIDPKEFENKARELNQF